MRTALLLGLCFAWLSSSAQTVLPNPILDSMIFEVRKGRVCDTVMRAQQNEIQALGLELIATGKALELSQNESKTLSALVTNARDYSGILTQQFILDKKKLKEKIKTLWVWVIGEGATILVMILLL